MVLINFSSLFSVLYMHIAHFDFISSRVLYGAWRPREPRWLPKPLPGAPLPRPPCCASPRIHPGVVLAAVASLGLVTTDSSLGRRSLSAEGSVAAVVNIQ